MCTTYSAPVPRLKGQKSSTLGRSMPPYHTMMENQPYLWNGKAYELRTWYTDGARKPALTCVTDESSGWLF